MIKRIYIDNYKCLVNFELNLRPTVLLLGVSGSGKTAVLDVMYAIRKLLAGDIRINDRLAFHPSTLTRWQTRRTQLIEIAVEADGCSFRYGLEVEHAPDQTDARIVEESLVGDGRKLFSFKLGEVQLYRDDGSEGPAYGADWTESALARVVERPVNTLLTAFKKAVSGVVVCGVSPAHLRAVSSGEDPRLDRYAENFVDWYRYTLQEDPVSASRHIEALAEAIDGFRTAGLTNAGPDARILTFDFITAGNSYRLPFDQLSDGQRALVMLYAFLHVGNARSAGVWLFLDEPENFVALPEIQPWLLALVELCEDTPSQAVLCSHHPELIDYLGPDCGMMLRRETSGATTVRPISALAPDNGLRLSESVARGWI